MYCGRLSQEKSPELLLQAFQGIDQRGKSLIYVGDGSLRDSMEDYAKKHNLRSVRFFGFQDRLQIYKYYAVADALALPSEREATGGVVNEAMASGLPVIISDQVGFGADFVHHGQNGFIFPSNNHEELGRYLHLISGLSYEEKIKMGEKSLEIMNEWLDRDLPENLVEFLERMQTGKSNPTILNGQSA